LSEGALTQESDPFASDPFGGDAGGGSSTLQPKLSAQEFLERNGISFPPGAIAKFVPATSTLIVRNTADQVNLIETLVENSFGDVSKMVKVEVRILEIDEENLTEIGFDWLLSPFNLDSDSILTGGTAGNTSPGNLNDYPAVPVGNPITSGLRTGDLAQARDGIDDLLLEGGGGAIPPTARAPGIFSINGNLTSPNFQGVLRMVAQRSGRDLMTATSVVTRSGQLGSVRNVREFIYPTEYDPPEIPDQVGFAVGPANGTAAGFPVTPANPAAFETREIGAALEVEPLLDGDGVTVLLNLSPEFTFFQGFVNYGSPINTVGADPPVALTDNRILMPVFRTLRNTTSVNVYDGETVVLGGLLTEAVSHVQDKVPLLGDAPLVGHLFRSESESRRKKAVIFFVTPTIIDPAGVPLRTREPAQVSLNTPEG
ncbi:MAG: type II and III secretion system protein, partial [Verrucomicrobiota bacterium]